VQWLEYSSELLTFSRIWSDISQAIHDPCVIGPHFLFEAIKLGDESIHLLRIVLFLSFFYLFVELAEFTVGFQLGLIAPDCVNEFLRILDRRLWRSGRYAPVISRRLGRLTTTARASLSATTTGKR
jgi:hypothetical protein